RAISAGAEVAYAVLDAESVRHGAAVGGHVYAALSDSVMLGAVGHWAVQPGTTQVGTVAASVLWKLDVVQWIPFATLDVGPLFLAPPERGVSTELDLAFGLGVDYLMSRELSVGAHARYHLVATDPSRVPAYVTVGFRVEYRWD